MLGSTLLGTAVGLVLLFATTSLFCSGITEWLSNVLQMRAKYLLTGMRAMLDGPEGGGAADESSVLWRSRTYLQAARVELGTHGQGGAPPQAAGPVWSGEAQPVPGEPPAAAEGTPSTSGEAPAAGAPSGQTTPRPRGRTAWAVIGTKRREVAAEAARQDVHAWVKDPAVTSSAATLFRELGTTSPRPTAPLVTIALFDSPLLRSLQSRRIKGVGSLRNPQYVSGKTFARALVDLLVPADPEGPVPVAEEIGKLRAAVLNLPEELPLRRQLLAFLTRADTTVAGFERAVEQWYDEQMAKMAGWYKRWARVILGVVGFLVAVAVNVDTVQVAHSLYVDAPLQQAVVATADAGTLCQGEPDLGKRQACVDGKLGELRAAGIPFGWPDSCDPAGGRWAPCWAWAPGAPGSPVDAVSTGDVLLKLLGWLITAFAVSFGAPFWFEALSRLGSLRNAGTKPSSSTAPG
jgi:hypothetical protein